MPTFPTQAERTAALSRLRDHIQDPDRVLLRLADLQVLLNPNTQAVALAAENEALRGRIAELEGALGTIDEALDRYHSDVGIEPGTMQIWQVLNNAATHYLERQHFTSEAWVLRAELEKECDDLRADPADAMLRIPFSEIPEGWHKLAPADHLPCPFCGGSATVSSAVDASIAPKIERWNATALCRSCGATGPSATGSTHTEGIANAWAAWDRRVGGAR